MKTAWSLGNAVEIVAQQGYVQLMNKTSIKRLAEKLVNSKLIGASEMECILTNVEKDNLSFINYLVKNNCLPAKKLAYSVADLLNLKFVDLQQYDLSELPISLVSESLIRKYRVLPLSKDNEILTLAISDPCFFSVINEIKFHTGFSARAVIVEEDKLSRAIDKILTIKAKNKLSELVKIESKAPKKTEEKLLSYNANSKIDDEPIVNYINKLLSDAVRSNASDLHFEPYEKNYRIRIRIDGILHVLSDPPYEFSNQFSARLKIMARLDISEKRLPQDGRFKFNYSKEKSIDCRISTCPTLSGEKIAVRFLSSKMDLVDIKQLGLSFKQKTLFSTMLQKNQGMILVTGPTGSGKTITLYTALKELNSTEKNISTVEDPIEIAIPGINQVAVNTKTGLNFSLALRAFLRQDPDVIMIGEIRDLETAEISIKAAQTGHLVLSTLHTNSASETLVRLMNMGVEAFNVAHSVNLIIAQRLVRRLCLLCKTPQEFSKKTLLDSGFKEEECNSLSLYQENKVGCERCHKGYSGRIGIFEIIPITEKIKDILLAKGTAKDIYHQGHVVENNLTLRESGLEKVREGTTNLAEILRIT